MYRIILKTWVDTLYTEDLTNYLVEDITLVQKLEDNLFVTGPDELTIEIRAAENSNIYRNLFLDGGIYNCIIQVIDSAGNLVFGGDLYLGETRYNHDTKILIMKFLNPSKTFLSKLRGSSLFTIPKDTNLRHYRYWDFLRQIFLGVNYLTDEVYIYDYWYDAQRVKWEMYEEDKDVDRNTLIGQFELIQEISRFFGHLIRLNLVEFDVMSIPPSLQFYEITVVGRDMEYQMPSKINIDDVLDICETYFYHSGLSYVIIPGPNGKAELIDVSNNWVLSVADPNNPETFEEYIEKKIKRENILDLRPELPTIATGTRELSEVVFGKISKVNNLWEIPFWTNGLSKYNFNYVKQVYRDLFYPQEIIRFRIPLNLSLYPLDFVSFTGRMLEFTNLKTRGYVKSIIHRFGDNTSEVEVILTDLMQSATI
ncbi:MAG: hypothetical protein QXN68_06370 [Thermoplasmata archaeon]